MRKKLYILLLSLPFVWSCNRQLEPIKLTGEAQGTFFSITYYDEQNRNFEHEIDSILREFDLSASLWVDSSLLQRVNRNEDSVLTPMFCDLLEKSLQISEYTNGAFDCRVGPLVAAWGFSFKEREDLSDAQIDSLLRYARGNVVVEQDCKGRKILKKEFPQTALDFNAIAQGYSVDIIAAWLSRQGVENYLVDVGGEVIARGQKPNGDPWKVGVERPATDKYSAPTVEVAIALRDMSVVTSGNYRKYYEKNGIRYSHTIDPATGRPVEHTLLSASVIDPESWRADALATAFMVMGLDKALEFVKSHPQNPAAFFIYSEGGEYKTYATPEFQELITE